MKTQKTLFLIMSLILVSLLLIAGCKSGSIADGNGDETTEVRRFSIGTAGTAGALYPSGVAKGELITKRVPGFAATGEATGGSVENIRNLRDGSIEWAMTQSDIGYFAYHGLGDYADSPAKELRALFSYQQGYAQSFTFADSDINSITDIKGKVFGVGPAGSGGEMQFREILKHYGMSYDDFTPELMPDAEMCEALKDGRIDGFYSTHPLGSAPLVDLAANTDVKMIPVGKDKSLFEAFSCFLPSEIPVGIFEGVDEPVPTISWRIIMCTSTKADFSEDDIYLILKTLWEYWGEWASVHPANDQEPSVEKQLSGISFPLHPGAVKFYEELGADIPEELYPPEMKK